MPETNEIHLTAELLDYSSFCTCSVLFHEIYHALQYQVVTDALHFEQTGEISGSGLIDIACYKEQIPDWTEEMNNYIHIDLSDGITTEEMQEYEAQELEVSAEDYSMRRLTYYVEQGYIKP